MVGGILFGFNVLQQNPSPDLETQAGNGRLRIGYCNVRNLKSDYD